MIKKKMISVFMITVLMLLSTSANVYASDSRLESSNIIVYRRGIDDSVFENDFLNSHYEIHYLSEDRGNDVPTENRNLAGNPYYYSLNNMYHYVFTNYRFPPDSNGAISVYVGNISALGIPFTVELYQVGFFGINPMIYSFSVTSSDIIGIGFPGLDTTRYYYMKFVNDDETVGITAGGWIHHPGDSIPTN